MEPTGWFTLTVAPSLNGSSSSCALAGATLRGQSAVSGDGWNGVDDAEERLDAVSAGEIGRGMFAGDSIGGRRVMSLLRTPELGASRFPSEPYLHIRTLFTHPHHTRIPVSPPPPPRHTAQEAPRTCSHSQTRAARAVPARTSPPAPPTTTSRPPSRSSRPSGLVHGSPTSRRPCLCWHSQARSCSTSTLSSFRPAPRGILRATRTPTQPAPDGTMLQVQSSSSLRSR